MPNKGKPTKGTRLVWEGVEGTVLPSEYGNPDGTTKLEIIGDDTFFRNNELFRAFQGGEDIEKIWNMVKGDAKGSLHVGKKRPMNKLADAPMAVKVQRTLLALFGQKGVTDSLHSNPLAMAWGG